MTTDTTLLARSGERSPATDRGEATRRKVLDAARVVFEDRGYQRTTVADIVKRAGVAHGTFNKYFESKDDVFRALTNEIVAAMFDRTRQPTHAPDPITRITRANWLYLEAYREDARFLAVVWEAMFDPDYRAFWVSVRGRWAATIERWVEREVRDGGADRRLEPRVAARALGLMMETFAHHWFVLGETYDEQEALTTLTQLWLNGLRLRDVDDVEVASIAAEVLARHG